MSSANKAKGSLYERQLEEWINESGVKARRLPRAGSKDIGDLAIELSNGHVIVIEAKNVKNAAGQMAEFLRQADVEAFNYEVKYHAQTYGVVATKTRQKDIGASRITLTLETLLDFLNWERLA